jgi:hypothetical protein
MTPDQSHVAGLELALAELAEYSPTAHALGEYHLRPLIHKAKSAPAEVAQGEAVEVVCITQGGCNVTWTATKELTPAGTALMSVNQHNRTVAAMATQPDAELVELLSMISSRGLSPVLTEDELARIDAKLASLRT